MNEPCRFDDPNYRNLPEDDKKDWDLYSDLELAEMWFDSEGIKNWRSVDKGNNPTLVVEIEEHCLILHELELEERAELWRYNNE